MWRAARVCGADGGMLAVVIVCPLALLHSCSNIVSPITRMRMLTHSADGALRRHPGACRSLRGSQRLIGLPVLVSFSRLLLSLGD